jgi:hypothetical protein
LLLKQIGDKIDEVTGDVITLHQQQLLLFPDYYELAPYLRQRAKTVPLATNESDRQIQVSGSIASSESTIPPPPTTGSTVDPSTVGDGGIRLSVLDTVAGLPTFDYGDRNADLTALAATILDGPANVNSQDEDTHSTAMEAHPTFQGTSDTSRHIRHFMSAHQGILDDTSLEEEDTYSTAMESQPIFQEQLNAAPMSPSLTSRSVTQQGKSLQRLQHSVDTTILQRTVDKTPEHNAAFGQRPRDTPNNSSSGSSSSLFIQRAQQEAAMASVRNKTGAQMTERHASAIRDLQKSASGLYSHAVILFLNGFLALSYREDIILLSAFSFSIM